MKLIIPLLLTLMFSCASNNGRYKMVPKKPADTSHVKYVKKFEKLWGDKIANHGVTTNIGYIYQDGKPRTHTTGVCHMIENKVTLNAIRWHKLSPLKQEFLVYHELGHCALRRGHPDHQANYLVPEFLEVFGCPASIMNSGTTKYKMTDMCIGMFYDYYIYELFASKGLRDQL